MSIRHGIRTSMVRSGGRLLAIAGLTLATAFVAAGPAQAVTHWNGASNAHPYSNPVWWPLPGDGVKMACYHGNGAACRNPLQHTVYAMDIAAPNYSSMPVYAMGAGVVHVESTGWRCNTKQSRGNWLYIDHGNGTRSEYGHLGKIYVHTGDFVTAKTRIATVGQSGYSKCASNPQVRYIWAGVRHGRSYVHVTNTYTCQSGRRVTWPQQLATHPTNDWNKVPAKTPLPTNDRSCTPTGVSTPTKPANARMGRDGHHNLRVTWRAASRSNHVNAVSVQLQEWHPSIRRWLDYRSHQVRSTATSTVFTHLPTGRHFKARVWMANSTGWSAPSYWASGIPS